MKSLVLASDLGSSGCKTVVVDLDDGKVIASARADYGTTRLHSGWAEQDPDEWYNALRSSVKQVVSSPDVDAAFIAGFALVGVTHTAVLVGSDGRPLAPSILMFDSRSASEADAIAVRWGDEVYKRTLNVPTPVWTWPQFEWLRLHRPEIWGRVASIKFQKDYVRDRITSPGTDLGHVTDHIDAAGSLLFDPIQSAWVPEFYEELGIDIAMLPSIVDPATTVGEVSRSAAEDLGLVAGTPVLAGTTDTAAEMVGSGAVRVGQGIVKLASVGRVAVVAESPVLENHILNYRHLLNDYWYPGTASKFAASAYGWLRGSLWGELNGPDAYQIMDEAAASVPPGSSGVVFQPHLSGQWAPYWDEDLRAGFLGLSIRHGREHFTRAVLEGVAFSILDVLEDLKAHDLVASELRLIGHGAVSALWAQMMADVIGRPLSVPTQVDAAYGSALLGAMGVSLLADTPEAIENVIDDRRIHYFPNEVNTQMYGELFEIYRSSVSSQQILGRQLREFTLKYGGVSS